MTRRAITLVALLCVLTAGGCTRQKTTAELLADLKGSDDRDRVIAVRLLPERQGDAAEIVPALIAALKDRESDIRWSAAIGLGRFGTQARDAIPALQAARRDRDARVREAARTALRRIEPKMAPAHK